MATFPFRHHRTCLLLTERLLGLLGDDPGIGKPRHIAKGRALWRPSDTPDRMYILERGRMAIQKVDEDGRELLLQVVDAGEPFGELCFCAEDGFIRRTTAVATRDSEVVEFPYARLLKHIGKRPDLLDALVATFCVRLSECELRAEALAYRDAEQRLGRLLLMLATRPHMPARPTADLVVTHSELAMLSAMSRAHVTVVLTRLRTRGAVQYARTGPITVDIAKLGAVVGRARRQLPPSGV